MTQKSKAAFYLIISLIVLLFLSCASSPPITEKMPKIISSQGHFQSTACDSVIDTNTGLEWLIGPDELMGWKTYLSWMDKVRFCNGVCCDKKWRTPTLMEISTLKSHFQSPDGTTKYLLDPLFKELAGGENWRLWAKENKSISPPISVGLEYRGGNTRAKASVPQTFSAHRHPVLVRSHK